MTKNPPENPQLTNERLIEMEYKLLNNKLIRKDLEELSHFLCSFNMEDCLQEQIEKRGFNNYQNFINYTTLSDKQKHMHFEEGIIIGYIKECINMLKKLINNN